MLNEIFWAENHEMTEWKIIIEIVMIDLPKAFITIDYIIQEIPRYRLFLKIYSIV